MRLVIENVVKVVMSSSLPIVIESTAALSQEKKEYPFVKQIRVSQARPSCRGVVTRMI